MIWVYISTVFCWEPGKCWFSWNKKKPGNPFPRCCPDFTVARRDPNGSLPRGFQGRESILGGFGPKDPPALPGFFFGGGRFDNAWWYLCFWVDFLFCFDFCLRTLFFWCLIHLMHYKTWKAAERKIQERLTGWRWASCHVSQGSFKFIHTTRSIIGRCFFQTSPTSKIH